MFRSLLLGLWYDPVQGKGVRNKRLSHADHRRNQEIAVTRSGGEHPFATYKQQYGLARTRFMGLTKDTTVCGLVAIAVNIRKGVRFF